MLNFCRLRLSVPATGGWKASESVTTLFFGLYAEDWKSRVPSIVEGYELRDIFNVDETGLLFRAIPDKTLIEKGKKCSGGKLAKERLTISLCCNALGEKEPPLVISKSLRPRCFKGVDIATLGLKWRANSKAWMTGNIFQEWLQTLNEKMKIQDRKIILLLDNATCHPTSFLFSNLKLTFLPPNTTSCLQPLDQGIIQSFKMLYRRKLVRTLLARMDNAENASQLTKQINVLDAVRWIKTAWEDVKPETITRCFAKCGISQNLLNMEVPEDKSEEKEYRDLCEAAKIEEVIEDEDVQCFDLTDDWESTLKQQACRSNTSSVSNTELLTEETMETQTDEEEEEVPAIEPLPLKDSLVTVTRLKAMFANLDPERKRSRVFESLDFIEEQIEDIIIKKKMKSSVQTKLNDFFKQ